MLKRKLISTLLIILILFTASSCAQQEKSGRLSIVTTNFAMYDFARAVCGDSCDVTMLLKPGSESHDFEATLEDVAKIAACDIFLYVGGEGEEWVYDVMDSLGDSTAEIKTVCALAVAERHTEEAVNALEVEEEEEEHDGRNAYAGYDEHVWTSIPNAKRIMSALAESVAEAAPLLTDAVEENLAAYSTELDKIDAEMREVVSSAKRHTIVVADRFPFRYMTEEYGLTYYAAFSGCSSSTEPTLKTVNHLIEVVNEEGVPVIFTIEFSDGKTADAIARETGVRILTLNSAHNVSQADFVNGVTYAELMRSNISALKEALN